MFGRYQSAQTFVRQKSPQYIWTYCMIHRDAVADKKINSALNIVITVITVLNYIKMKSLKLKLLTTLFKQIYAEHAPLLFCKRSDNHHVVNNFKEEINIYWT